MYFVRYGELLATLCTTCSEDATTISGQHALTETMLVVSLAIVRLKSSLHCICFFIIAYYYAPKQVLS